MTTPNLELPEWAQNQEQPYTTVNEALRVLDCLTQLTVLDRNLNAPPGSPSDGDCYIVGSAPTGDWAGHANDVAMYIGTAWLFRTPKNGWRAYVADEFVDVRYMGLDSPPGWDVI